MKDLGAFCFSDTFDTKKKSKFRYLNFKQLLSFPILVIYVLFVISLLELYSLTGCEAGSRFVKQFLHIIFGLFVFLTVSSIPLKFWKKYANTVYLISIVLLIAVALFGKTVMGAKRWLPIGCFNIRIQPSEAVRVTLIIALSKYFSNISFNDIKYTRYLIGSIIFLLVPVVLVLKQPDLGTAMLLIFVYAAILFVVGVQVWKLAVLPIFAIFTAPIIWFKLHEYQKNRILIFLNPEMDPNGCGYHIIQSKVALGSGGLLGCGLTNGTQCQLDFVPEKYTDFILSAIGEELGLLGCFVILALYTLLLLYNYKVAITTKDKFLRYLVFGINAMMFFYIFINISMVSGLAPVVGVPLPFLSYGGSAIATLMFCEGLIVAVSKAPKN